ncbi:MAG: murein L,D-transpeptidase catalytic domain family protein [Bacteroidetes bacterium]|nr:murein L,D-transpeptidase catalytic domain family protein [Bacteroidota bacterium]
MFKDNGNTEGKASHTIDVIFASFIYCMPFLLHILFLTLGMLLFPGLRGHTKGDPVRKPTEAEKEFQLKSRSINRALHVADSLKPWLLANGYSTSLIFIADVRLSMDLKRFYAIQPDSQRLLHSAIMAHGRGKGSRMDSAVFSNVVGSLCTSEGRYRIGDSMWGEYGKGYRLHGLDPTNNNALKRLVVFHYYEPLTSEEHSDPLIYSSGCPMLATVDFRHCDALIQQEKKPVLMVIYK